MHRPSPALVVACVALFVALSGVSFAAVEATVPNNSVGSAQLKSNAVVAAKIASNAVVAAKIASNAVTSAKIASNAVNSAKVADGTLTAADFASGVVPAPVVAFARFLNGPIVVPVSATTLGSLTIPDAGSYVLWAKAYLTGSLSGTVSCTLQAQSDFDQSQAAPSSGSPAGVSLLVVHTYSAAGTADFQCSGSVPGYTANFIKISAIKVASVTNNG
jgi:hypothetical protein